MAEPSADAPPCVTHHGTHNTSVTCTDPISHLEPKSILAYWTTNTDPAGFHSGPGTPITVGGRRGTWRVQTDTTQVPNLGETELITVTVPTPGSRDSWYQLTALPRGPDTSKAVAQLKTMLHTVKWRPRWVWAAAPGCENHRRQMVQQPPAW